MAASAELLKQQNYDAQQSFDPAASIYMLRHDIDNYGVILPETMQQVHDEELTYIAEGIDRHSHTQFTLKHDDELGLTYFSKGQWRPYIGTLITGLETAQKEAHADPRKVFMADMASRDLAIGYDMQKLKPGESFAYYSAFPEQQHQCYGTEFIEDMGFQVQRKMGFIYRVEKQLDGSVVLDSHTIDNSSTEAYEAALFEANFNEAATMSDLVKAYDAAMFASTGIPHRAGRNNFMASPEQNAWDFVRQNTSLFNYYFNEITQLAYADISNAELIERKKQLTYGVWARTKELLTQSVKQHEALNERLLINQTQIAHDVQRAFMAASNRGEVMSGCGGSIRSKAGNTSPDDMFDDIFGQESESKKELSWHGGRIKKGECVNCHEGPKDVGVESWCKDCISGHCG